MKGRPITIPQAMTILRLYYRNKIGDCAEVGRLTDLSKNGVGRVVRFYGAHAHLRHIPEVKRWIAAARKDGMTIPDFYPDTGKGAADVRVSLYNVTTHMMQTRQDAVRRHNGRQADNAAQHTSADPNGPQRGVQERTGQATGTGPQLAMDFGGPQPVVVELPEGWMREAAEGARGKRTQASTWADVPPSVFEKEEPFPQRHVLPWEELSLLVRPQKHDTAPLPDAPPVQRTLAQHRADIIAGVELVLEIWTRWERANTWGEFSAAMRMLQEAYDAYNQDV